MGLGSNRDYKTADPERTGLAGTSCRTHEGTPGFGHDSGGSESASLQGIV